jgi:hypothetical protein
LGLRPNHHIDEFLPGSRETVQALSLLRPRSGCLVQ